MIALTNTMKFTATATAFGMLSTAAFAAGGTKLVLDGKVASTSVRVIDGAAYVKVSDVASAMGRIVVKRPDGYEIAKPGGANQVSGLEGKIGDQLFDGKWRFKVTKVETASSYALKTEGEPYDAGAATRYNSATRTLTPNTGSTLIVIHCTAANGQKTKQTLWIANSGSNTALTDDDGHSYPPAVHDFNGAPIQSPSILPGAKIDFPIVFSVPEGAVLKDLVFTLRNNDSSSKGDEVRVSLKG